jgi:hypothetical protein
MGPFIHISYNNSICCRLRRRSSVFLSVFYSAANQTPCTRMHACVYSACDIYGGKDICM